MKITEERSNIYGDFSNIANISQNIKDMYYTYCEELDPTINEGVCMIVHKLARIINNGSRFIDNYRDIQGYCQLIINHLEDQSNEALDSVVMYKEKKNGQWSELKNNK